ncbi:MAG: EamA family transporter [Steroidobacteraceae bacterium]
MSSVEGEGQPPAGRPAASRASIVACLGALYIVWGTTYFAIKVAITGLSPFFLVGTRFTVAGIAVLGWQLARGQRLPTLRRWPAAALIGFLLLVVGNGCVTIAEHWISSGATVALGSILPLATALWSGVFGRWPRRAEWGAIALGGVGAAIMLTGRDLSADLIGSLVILTGVTSWSFGTVLSRHVPVPEGPSGLGAELLAAGLMGLILSAALREPWVLPHAGRVWCAWGYLVVFGSLIGFSAFRYLVERVSPTLASTYAYVNPPVALLVGWGLGDESFSPSLLIGLPVVLTSVALLGWVHARTGPRAAVARDGQPASAGAD